MTYSHKNFSEWFLIHLSILQFVWEKTKTSIYHSQEHSGLEYFYFMVRNFRDKFQPEKNAILCLGCCVLLLTWQHFTLPGVLRSFVGNLKLCSIALGQQSLLTNSSLYLPPIFFKPWASFNQNQYNKIR